MQVQYDSRIREQQIPTIMMESSHQHMYPQINETMNDVLPKVEQPRPLKSILRSNPLEDERFDYTPADLDKAQEYRDRHSYKFRLATGQYQHLPLMASNQELVKFGVGTYLYVELFRRLTWLFLFLSFLVVTPIVLNCLGNRYDQYTPSFSNYLIRTAFGNYNRMQTAYDPYLQTALHAAACFAFFLFIFVWKAHTHREIKKFQKDQNVVHPRKYCIEMEGLPKFSCNAEDVKKLMEKFGPVYEVCIVRNFKSKLALFQQLDEIQTEIKDEQLEMKLKGSEVDPKKLKKLKIQREQLLQQISVMDFNPKNRSFYVHFQHQSSKKKLLEYYNERYMFSSWFHKCCFYGCACCLTRPAPQYLYKGIKPLTVKNMDVPDPQEINWESVNVTRRSKAFRVLLSAIIILIFLGVCLILMAICSVFITSNTINCTQNNSMTLEQASTADEAAKKCFCASKLFEFFNQSIKQICLSAFKQIYLSNGLQLAAALVSVLTNILFTLMVDRLVHFTKPKSLTSALLSKSIIMFLFLFINSCLTPVLIFSNMFGFKMAEKLSLLNLNTSDIPYYSDFTDSWYRVVSPYFTNFMIIDFFVVWLKFFWTMCYESCRLRSLKKKQGKTIQKKLNIALTEYKFDVTIHLAETLLVVFMAMFYGAGIPVLIPIAFVVILSRYITGKILMLRFSSRIEGLTEDFNQLANGLLPFAPLLSGLLGIWMLTANEVIYPNGLNLSLPLPTTGNQNLAYLLSRVYYVSFTFVLCWVIFLYIFLYNTLVRLLQWLFGLCFCTKSWTNSEDEPTRSFSQASFFLNVLCSYDIHQNDRYRNAIQNIQRFVLQKQQEKIQ